MGTLEAKIIGYFIMAYVLSILIVVISSMTIRVVNNHNSTSASYRNSVKWIAGLSLMASLSVLIAAPSVSFPSDNRVILAVYLFAVFLACLIGALAGMAIDSVNKSDEADSYKNAVRGIGGTCLGAAIIVVVGGPILVLMKDKRTMAMVLVSMLLAALIAAVSGMGIHGAATESSDSYKTAARTVVGFALAGALVGLIGIPLMAYKMKS